jgi:Helix-turn-helix domain
MRIQVINVVMLPDGRMDRKNAARYLGLSVKTLAMHVTRGTGPKFIKRGRVFYFREDLDQWLRDDSPGGGSDKGARRATRLPAAANLAGTGDPRNHGLATIPKKL